MTSLRIFNTLTREKERFIPLNPPHVGLYVCGPTVYGDPHLGHARPAITFDLLYRYLGHLGFKVRYVRNITDVGHLENDADDGEDKVQKKARLEQLEPMEVVQHYTNSYHDAMRALNVKSPSIEPRASAHVIEQLALVKKIMEQGYAYESNGSVFFDVKKYSGRHHYGSLSGRVTEELQGNNRVLEGQSGKKNPQDFALWKKASPSHIMRWPSDWGDGFPGWHLECTAMSAKYLGEKFDIHGGGMDLLFPHHECEIAQATAAHGYGPARYWMHNNMVTINGQKMGKSLGNFITLAEFFTGQHHMLDKAWNPMTIRFFILQAHYRGTLDFSNEALHASEKGLNRLLDGVAQLERIKPGEKSEFDVPLLRDNCFAALDDDLNSPVLLAHLFDAVKVINSAADGKISLGGHDLENLKSLMQVLVNDILGLEPPAKANIDTALVNDLVELALSLRQKAKNNKDWPLADEIRDHLSMLGITIKDGKEGSKWEMK